MGTDNKQQEQHPADPLAGINTSLEDIANTLKVFAGEALALLEDTVTELGALRKALLEETVIDLDVRTLDFEGTE